MTNKKIYLVTANGQQNFGTLLQATALIRCFREMGYDVSLLGNWRVLSSFIKHPSLFFARVINKFNAKKRKEFFNPSPYEISELRKGRIEQYKRDNFQVEDIVCRKDWKNAIKNQSVFVSGSDIIWQPANGYPAKYFLDFTYSTNLNRFSYASSFGAKELPKQYYRAYKKYLSKFSGVSVREESAAKMLENIISRKVQRVVDPTMLLTKDLWDEYAVKAQFSKDLPEKYILCYFVMDDVRYWQYVKKIVDTTNLSVVVLPMHYNDEKQPYIIIDDATPYEFIWLIKKADFVCTDSFHACVFSMIYKKEFYLLRRARKDEDAKYDDFLNRYGLCSREIKDEKRFLRNKDVDYNKFEDFLNKDREDSLNYINSCLNN